MIILVNKNTEPWEVLRKIRQYKVTSYTPRGGTIISWAKLVERENDYAY